ncbi:MAG: hypothetical protein U9R34_04920 [Nanoarchaeota archaeon]|nr:hypothetical protein [Nanoarchaeota archaeon]
MGNESLIPVGESVDITCQHGSENYTISTDKTIIKHNGNFNTQTTSDKCAVGDPIWACIMPERLECSNQTVVEQVDPAHGMSGHGQGYITIIGVPEYTTAAIAFLMLFTGGGIAYLRNKKK